jgi:hypothetical protein
MKISKAAGLSIKLEKNGDGYLASVPGLHGGFAEGDTVEQAIFNCVDVVKMIAEYKAERGESGIRIL